MRRLGLLIATVGSGLALAACGGGGDRSDTDMITLSGGDVVTKSQAIDQIFERAPGGIALICRAIEVEGLDKARASFAKGFELAFPGKQLSADEVFNAGAERC